MKFERKKTRRSLAAAAVAVAVHAAPANAAVVYSGVLNQDIEEGKTFLDIGTVPGSSFFRADNFEDSFGVTSKHFQGTEFLILPTDPPFVPALVVAPGAIIGPSTIQSPTFASYSGESVTSLIYGQRSFGSGPLEFGESGITPITNIHPWPIQPLPLPVYGWVRWDSDAATQTVTLVDWAFEDSGVAIAAGDTGIAPVPLPASLPMGLAGLAMLGALGARRRKPG